VADHESRFNERGWVKPNDMAGVEVTLWTESTDSPWSKYDQHYRAASEFDGQYSADLMESFARTLALARLRGEL
jgi:hypothetical protein